MYCCNHYYNRYRNQTFYEVYLYYKVDAWWDRKHLVHFAAFQQCYFK